MKHEYDFVDHTDEDKAYPYALRISTPYTRDKYEGYEDWVDYIKTEYERRELLLLETVGYKVVTGHYDLLFYWFKTPADRITFKLVL